MRHNVSNVKEKDEDSTAASILCRITVNRSPQMWLLIKEAKALDRLGFTVPEAAVHAALQANRILLMEETLHDMLSEYYSVRPKASFNVAGNQLKSEQEAWVPQSKL